MICSMNFSENTKRRKPLARYTRGCKGQLWTNPNMHLICQRYEVHFRVHFQWVPSVCTFGYFSVLAEASTQREGDVREVAGWVRQTLGAAVSRCAANRLGRLRTRMHLRVHPVLGGCLYLTGTTQTTLHVRNTPIKTGGIVYWSWLKA